MSRRIISLNDSNWRFASVTQKPFGDVNDLDEAHDWLPAQVPGDVRLDLLRAGKIADPYYADNNEASQWVDARDWWYVRDLDVELHGDERAFLIFDGIDYQSAVFGDGKPLARHVGMFSRQVIELTANRHSRTQTPAPACPSSIAVRVWGSDALPKLHKTPAQRIWGRLIAPFFSPPYNEPFPDRYATLKCQMQFGWDFAPRLRTCGIWDDASVVIARSVFIEDAWIEATVTSARATVATVSVRLRLDSDREQNARIVCHWCGKNFASDAQTFACDVNLARGRQTRAIAFDLPGVRLWNPWDRGEPNVYALQVQILSPRSSEPLDTLDETFGVRAFELTRAEGASPNAEPWQFVVNGAREFVRGANWVPLDAMPGRLTRADYAARLQQARDANINFLRVWGGGLREKRAFYDLCDEVGILVWQEFPFAGAILDRFPRDRAFLAFVRAECGDIVRALRNHPSLVVWCGGNEFNTRGNAAIVKTLRAVVKDKDATRPFKPASPYRDESHNWRVWHRLANLRDYRDDTTPFLSEFGLQAMPHRASLEKFLPADALQAPHPLWEYHHAELKKLRRYARPFSNPCAQSSPSNLREFIGATQRAQALGLQIAIEHIRRRKPQTTGVAVWQFDDPWPSISWSVVDYYGTPKRAYAELKRLYAPVFASFDYALAPRRAGDVVRGDLWLINDRRDAFDAAEVRADLNGEAIYARRVDLAPDSAARVDALRVTLGVGENILRVRVLWREQTLADNAYDLNLCDEGEISLLDALLAQVGKWLMR